MPLSYSVPLSPSVNVFPIYAFPWGNIPLLCCLGIQSVALCHAHLCPIPEILAVDALDSRSDLIIFRELLSTYWSWLLIIFEFFNSAGWSAPSSVIVPSTSSRFCSIYFLKTELLVSPYPFSISHFGPSMPRVKSPWNVTSILFITFSARYDISLTLIFCCLFSLFGQIYLFSGLDDKDIPEIVNIIFIIIGNLAVYILDNERLISSIIFSIFYLVAIYFGVYRKQKFLDNSYSNFYSFVLSLIVWFGLIPTLTVMTLSYTAAILMRTQRRIKNTHSNYGLLNPIMCVFFFIYSLFKFPSAL